jgi:hypothetical protein
MRIANRYISPCAHLSTFSESRVTPTLYRRTPASLAWWHGDLGVGSVAMRELIYALRFRGSAQRVGIDGNVLKTATVAVGCAIQTLIGVDGTNGTLRPLDGKEATFESELVFTGESTFQQTGTIAFGESSHRLNFSSVGSGHLGPDMETNCRHGAAIWRVEGGDGQFAGATGLIVSNFFVNDAGEVTDHQFGVVFVQ